MLYSVDMLIVINLLETHFIQVCIAVDNPTVYSAFYKCV